MGLMREAMPSCPQIKEQYETIKALKAEFDVEYGNNNTEKLLELKAELQKTHESLQTLIWPFEHLPLKELKEQYQSDLNGYRNFGWLKTLTSSQEGITDEQGHEYPVLSWSDITKRLRQQKELIITQTAVMEKPRLLITPFALPPQQMSNSYSNLIEEKFVKEREEGNRRIPAPNSLLKGANGDLLELRSDGQNVSMHEDLNNLKYFPDWQEEDGQVKAVGGVTKQAAIEQVGAWRILITEDIPRVPIRGAGKTITREVTIKGEKITVSGTQVAGGLNVADQYRQLKKQNRAGFTSEDWFTLASLTLLNKHTVLDDDDSTGYLARLPGAVTATGYVLSAYWVRAARRAGLHGSDPKFVDERSGVRGALVV